VQANGKLLYKKEWKGPGSCPFIVARWSRDSTTAYGVGPTYRVLPAIKTLNHFAYLSLKNYDKHVDPVTSYEDDGVCNVDNGLDPGTWVPRAPGSKPPEAVESKARFDVQAFEIDEKRSVVRKAHYQDRPEQLGKTPPTAFQWADERAERARRMGTPATNLVQELQIPLYRRFTYLLNQRNVLPVITENGQKDGAIIALEPSSPLLRAQEQEELIRNDKLVEMVNARFGPQIGAIVIDIFAFAEEQRRLLGCKPLLLRKEEDIQSGDRATAAGIAGDGRGPGRRCGCAARRIARGAAVSGPNWGEFKQRTRGGTPEQTDADFDDICASALSGIAGRDFLVALRERFIERSENPMATEPALRVRVTQQQFVRDLEAARDRGLEAAKRRAEAASKTT
jgi:hypothetical protein